MKSRLPFLISLSLLFQFCAAPVMVASFPGKVAPTGRKISPEKAHELALPHLPGIFRSRCEKLHRNNPHWCEKEPVDHVVLKGDWYCITRTAYPYKTLNAYLHFAVMIHADTGELKTDSMND